MSLNVDGWAGNGRPKTRRRPEEKRKCSIAVNTRPHTASCFSWLCKTGTSTFGKRILARRYFFFFYHSETRPDTKETNSLRKQKQQLEAITKLNIPINRTVPAMDPLLCFNPRRFSNRENNHNSWIHLFATARGEAGQDGSLRRISSLLGRPAEPRRLPGGK